MATALFGHARTHLDNFSANFARAHRQLCFALLCGRARAWHAALLAPARHGAAAQAVREALESVGRFHPARSAADDASAGVAALADALQALAQACGAGAGSGCLSMLTAYRRGAAAAAALAALEGAFARAEAEVAACASRPVRWFHEVVGLLWCLCCAAAGIELLARGTWLAGLRAWAMAGVLHVAIWGVHAAFALGFLALLSPHRRGLTAARRPFFAPRRGMFASPQQQSSGLLAALKANIDPMAAAEVAASTATTMEIAASKNVRSTP